MSNELHEVIRKDGMGILVSLYGELIAYVGVNVHRIIVNPVLGTQVMW